MRLFFFIPIILLFSCDGKIKNSNPSIKIIKDSYGIGNVAPNTITKGYFVIQNIGNYPIKYCNLVVDCNCTNLDVNIGDSINPNEIDTINFTLNTTNMISNSVVNKCIRILTNSKPDLHRFYIVGKIR